VKEYRATARREHPYWVVTVEDVGVTQGRNLVEAEEMAADLVAVMTGEDAADITVQMHVDLSEEVVARLAESRRLSAEAQRLQVVAAEAARDAVTELRDVVRLSGRDIAKVLGVSEQRVSQIAPRRGATANSLLFDPRRSTEDTGATARAD